MIKSKEWEGWGAERRKKQGILLRNPYLAEWFLIAIEGRKKNWFQTFVWIRYSPLAIKPHEPQQKRKNFIKNHLTNSAYRGYNH